MKLSSLSLNPRLSGISWNFIEFFTLTTIFFLPFSKSIAEIGIITSLLLWLLRKFPYGEKFPTAPLVTAAYAVFFGFVLLSLIQVPPTLWPTGIRGVLKWAKHLAIFFMALDYFKDAKRTQRFAWVFLASMTVTCLDGFYQMFTGFDFIKHYSADIPGRLVRMQGPLSSPNDLAAFLIIGLPMIFFAWMEEKTWSLKSAVLAALTALFGVAFASTLSRGAMLALFISSVFYALCAQKKKALWLLAVIPAIVLASPMLRYNFISSLGPKDITVGERLKMWGTCLRMIQEHPILGNGVNLFAEKFNLFSEMAKSYKGYAHNCYLQMAAEIGIPGLLAFLLPLVFILLPAVLKNSAALQKSWLKSSLLVGIPAFLLQSALDTNFYALQAAMLFWLFWGLCAAILFSETGERYCQMLWSEFLALRILPASF